MKWPFAEIHILWGEMIILLFLFTKMKLALKNIALVFLMALMLAGALGLSFSRISCPMGQRFVFGSEMPPSKKNGKKCGENPCDVDPKKDDRKKETFQIKLDFQVCVEDINCWKGIDVSVVFSAFSKHQFMPFIHPSSYFSQVVNPPPLLNNATPPFLQTFLI